ncbi:MAG: hypothetical protein COU69_02740 [Candidatus Pacebacteria bacterium CG10_big_fil_rev_8_21_14_0_10_56_10]|nr:MAG: hypothetical protein COU69_02740 [Candidatus Pacebacteria bacterium CG10_big_fil_rev_8_21_14_0_10_56_10]
MTKPKQTILYVDTENLKYYIKKICKKHKKKANIENYVFERLFESALKAIEISTTRFYSAKLRFHKESPKKSQELIQKQRVLKANLEKIGYSFIISGNVRGQKVRVNGKEKLVFHEKGVDVRIAVDIVAEVCDGIVNKVILCSSDSDLQPAVSEVKKRGIEITYLGFESQPNKGLIYTCDRSILIRDSEILEALSKSQTNFYSS